jgi:hypothetical protein
MDPQSSPCGSTAQRLPRKGARLPLAAGAETSWFPRVLPMLIVIDNYFGGYPPKKNVIVRVY